ncbi:hypothetical protein AXK57_19415 [Tsukamurella pulmonis]|uniref:hypothetical protein n=1 Tax=Tsukamurella pulmonis TaxID=47312 RepID=UPI00079B63DA|nr:hypothetical protein [Tsukamurella pulmonis]KXP12459.1 hypothetical protein AXK57_19415 [Tsukamurella pulmonis]RDH13286.1 hypothetical protein DVB88_03220 [Tsukamurella pulmonis]
MEPPAPAELRLLTDRERALIDGALSFDFPGVDELRAQVPTLRVNSDRFCPCGCGTVELVADRVLAPVSTAANPLPVEAEMIGSGGHPLGGVIVFLDSGYLGSLEVYSFGGPLELPATEGVDWSGPDE